MGSGHMQGYRNEIHEAVRSFWKTRNLQTQKQGSSSGKKDYGLRGSVTGGKQLDGFIGLFTDHMIAFGLPEESIHYRQTVLPGYYRPTKEWDIVVVQDGQLVAAIELKSHVGPSFGNNFNNRVEEALGSASDIWAAYREGAFEPSNRPWLGYFMLLEKHEKSLLPVKNKEPYFPTLPEFRHASYQKRYEIFCRKLVRERIYDAAFFIVSEKEKGLEGKYEEPSIEIGFANFIFSLHGRISGTVTKFVREREES